MKKLIFGILAAATLIGGTATLAEAKTSFSIYFGLPYYNQPMGPNFSYFPNRGWYQIQPGYNNKWRQRMSCNSARRIVRNHGYRNVVAKDCVGSTYSFSTRRNNQRVTIYVNSRTGVIWRG
jgi:(2Fe-2S) ferredoxin